MSWKFDEKISVINNDINNNIGTGIFDQIKNSSSIFYTTLRVSFWKIEKKILHPHTLSNELLLHQLNELLLRQLLKGRAFIVSNVEYMY